MVTANCNDVFSPQLFRQVNTQYYIFTGRKCQRLHAFTKSDEILCIAHAQHRFTRHFYMYDKYLHIYCCTVEISSQYKWHTFLRGSHEYYFAHAFNVLITQNYVTLLYLRAKTAYTCVEVTKGNPLHNFNEGLLQGGAFVHLFRRCIQTSSYTCRFAFERSVFCRRKSYCRDRLLLHITVILLRNRLYIRFHKT